MATYEPDAQVTYYQPGVGTLAPAGVYLRARRKVLQVLDSASAWMIYRHVASAYSFLMDTHQLGDQLFVFGFSRGAYTARVLCGMLATVGLLRQGMVEMMPFAWDAYRGIQPSADDRNRREQFRRAAHFKKRFAHHADLRFLGIWDTVSSVGTPWRPRVFPRSSANRELKVVRHAVALDERRAMFAQNLWRGNPKHKQDVKEVWFAGVHGDVGGGYPDAEAGLALITLAWMVREAKELGMTFDPRTEAEILPDLDPEAVARHFAAAPLHDSLTKAWQLLEYLPMPRWEQAGNGRWQRRWRAHAGRRRYVPPEALVHTSVFLRTRAGADYAPPNLPAGATGVA
jgi:uncharacterized protein (DUF2235 family)